MKIHKYTLSQLVDLALCVPEAGAVNFNILHSILKVILHQLGIQDIKPWGDTQHPAVLKSVLLTPQSVKGKSGRGTKSDEEEADKPPKAKRSRSAEDVTERVLSKEEVEKLYQLPPKEIRDAISTSGEKKAKIIAEIWQATHLTSRMDAAEEGIEKLSILMDSVVEEFDVLNSEVVDDIKPKLDSILQFHSYTSVEKTVDQLTEAVEELRQQKVSSEEYAETTQQVDSIKNRLDVFDEGLSGKVGKDELNSLIDLDRMKEKFEEIDKILKELLQNQEEPGQIKELKALCEKLREEVDTIKGRLDDMATEFAGLLENVTKLSTSAEGMMEAQKRLSKLEEGFKELSKQSAELMADGAANRRHIEELQTCLEELRLGTMGKDELADLLKGKADIKDLDSKVNQTLFEELSATLQDLLNRYNGNEQSWKKALEELTSQMEEKLSRADFDALQEPLVNRIQALMASLKKLRDAVNKSLFGDAAGVTKCISCGRPARLAGRDVSRSENRSESPIEKCSNYEQGSGVSARAVSPYDPESGVTSAISLPDPTLRKEVDLVGYDGRTYKGCVKIKRHGVDDQDVTLDAREIGGKKRIVLKQPACSSESGCGPSKKLGLPKHAFESNEAGDEIMGRGIEKGRSFRAVELVPQNRYTGSHHTTTMPLQRGNQYTKFKVPDSKSREEMGLVGFDRQMYHGSVKKKDPDEESEIDPELEQLLNSPSQSTGQPRTSRDYPRYCGAKHTLTEPQQRGLKYTKMRLPDHHPMKEETELYGSDGIVYRGDVIPPQTEEKPHSPPPPKNDAQLKPSIVRLNYEPFKKEVDLVGYDGRVYKGCIVEIPPNELRRANRSRTNRKHIYLPAQRNKK